MNLKKINSQLQQSLLQNNFTEAFALQSETFSIIKSGKDAIIQAKEASGKTTMAVIAVIQNLEKPYMVSPRAIIMVANKDKALEIQDLFIKINTLNKLRVYTVHEHTVIDNDKNLISAGIDVLIGTPAKLNELFSSAGYDVNQLKIMLVDDIDVILKNRQEPILNRLFTSISKVQFLFFCTHITEKVFLISDKFLKEPYIYEE